MILKTFVVLSFLISPIFSFAEESEVKAILKNFLSKNPAEKLKWDWGEAVFLYGLSKYPEFNPILKKYSDRWFKQGAPAIDRSDRCAPALPLMKLYEQNGDQKSLRLVQNVIDYLKSQKQNELGTIDHLGHSWMSFFYPSSVWVDSLMMYAVLAGEWGKFRDILKMKIFALSQPLTFAQVLQDPRSGLFYHAYLFKMHKTIPDDNTFWLRGNGWVLVSLIELIDLYKNDSEVSLLVGDNSQLFKELAHSILAFQRPNGAFETVLNRPGYSYDETSGTLLVAYAFAKAHRLGLLPSEYQEAGKRAFNFARSKLVKTKNGLALTGISGPTNPGSAFYYKHVTKKTDLSYGIGAYLLAASEL